MDRLNTRQQVRIAACMRRRFAPAPGVEAAGGDLQQPSHGGNGPGGLIRFHELEPLSGTVPVSRANQAAAFDKISRSTSGVGTLRGTPPSSSARLPGTP